MQIFLRSTAIISHKLDISPPSRPIFAKNRYGISRDFPKNYSKIQRFAELTDSEIENLLVVSTFLTNTVL